MERFYGLLGTVAVVAAFAFTGCGGTVVDSTAMSEDLAAYLRKSLHERVKSVDCPSGEPVEKGRTIKCEVRLQGGDEKPLEVEITSEEADYRVKHYGGANE